MANETKIVITAATAQAEAAIKSLGNTVGGATRQMFDLSGVAATLTGALSITAFAGMIKQSIDAADELNNLSIKTGTSVEQLAGLKFAAEQNDTSLQAVAGAAKKLASSLSDKPEMFAKLGITAKDSTGALVQMADIFAAMPDGAEKTALAVKLMGKSGEEMIPILNNGSAALRRQIEEGKAYNPVTAESARMAAEFNDNLDKLSASSGALGMQMANSVLPELTQISSAMADAAREGGLLDGVLVGLASTYNALFTDDLLPRTQQIGKRLEALRRRQDDSTRDPNSWFFNKDATNRDNEEMLALQRELEQLREKSNPATRAEQTPEQIAASIKKQRELMAQVKLLLGDKDPAKPKGGKSEAERIREQEQQALDTLRRQADGYAKLSEVEQLRYDIAAGKYKGFEADKLREMELLAQQIDLSKAGDELAKDIEKQREEAHRNNIKVQEEASRNQIKAQEEANRVLYDLDPMLKLQAEWEKLLTLKEAGLLTDEQIGQAYAKTFDDISKSGDDAFKSLENAVRGWGSSFTDEMTKMVRTGKLNFSSLADSIINDLIRIQIQKNVTDKLVTAGTGFLDGLFRGGASSGTASAPSASTGATASSWVSSVMPFLPSFAVGTDYVPYDMVAQIHKGERIVPAAFNPVNGGASAAPSVVVQVINQSGQNVSARQQGGPQFNGRDWVLGIVLDAADSDPNFRNSMGMAR